MGRVKLCLATIIAVMGISVFGLWYLDVRTDRITELTERVMRLAKSGNRELALKEEERLYREWEDYQNAASIFVRNEKIADVQNSMARIRPMIENDCDELYAEFANVLSGLEWIVESEIPRISNVM